MVYSTHALVQFGGSISFTDFPNTPAEIWSCGIRFAADGGDPLALDMEAFLTAVQNPLATWYHDATNGMSNNTTLDFIKANLIGPDGKYVDKTNTHQFDWSPVIAGGVTPTVLPIASLVFSWRTAKKRGPGAHGRIYPPNFTYGSGASVEVDTVDQGSAANAGQRLLRLLTAAWIPAGLAHAVVASKVDASLTPVTLVSVGNVWDTQRRRKNALAETYVTVAA